MFWKYLSNKTKEISIKQQNNELPPNFLKKMKDLEQII